MEKEPYFQPRTPETAEELTMVGLAQFMCRFGLHDHTVLDQKIQPVQANPLVEEGNWNKDLALNLQPQFPKDTHEGLDIDLLEEAISKLVVNEIEGPNDLFRDLGVKEIDFHFWSGHAA
jgi:hypothetical protein